MRISCCYPISATWRRSVCVILLAAGCATAPVRRPTQIGSLPRPCTRCLAVAPATASVMQRNALLDLVPAPAVAALIVRQPLLQTFTSWLAQSPAMRRELAEYSRQRLGVDITAVEGLVVFSTRVDSAAQMAVWLLLPAAARAALGTTPTTRNQTLLVHHGERIFAGDEHLAAAVLGPGLLIGHLAAVRLGVELWHHAVAPVTSTAPLAVLRRIDEAGTQWLGAVRLGDAAALNPQVSQLGIELASASYGPHQRLTLRVSGEKSRLSGAISMFELATTMGLGFLEQRKQQQRQASTDLLQGAGAILAYHQAKALLETLKPKLVDNDLLIEASLAGLPISANPQVTMGLIGIITAIVLPQAQKYLDQLKTAEVRRTLDQAQQALRDYQQQNSRKRRRFRWPTTTPWSSPIPCCQSAAKPRCALDAKAGTHPTWKSLGISFDEAKPFRLRLSSGGSGKQAWVVVMAESAADCQQAPTTLCTRGTFDQHEQLQFTDTAPCGSLP